MGELYESLGELGEFGFWLAVGIVVAVWILSSGQQARERERQKQETLREMMRLEAEGKLTPETLAYMRARDAAEGVIVSEMMGTNMSGATSAAFIVGLLSVFGGLLSAIFAWASTKSWEVPLSLLLGIWAGGLLIACGIYFVFRDRKNVPPSGE